MPSPKLTYDPPSVPPSLGVKEEQVEYSFIGKLQGLKYEYRPDIRDRASLERNFREKFETLNRVHLSDGEFARLLDEIVTPDVYTAARTLRERNAFTCTRTTSTRCGPSWRKPQSSLATMISLDAFTELMTRCFTLAR